MPNIFENIGNIGNTAWNALGSFGANQSPQQFTTVQDPNNPNASIITNPSVYQTTNPTTPVNSTTNSFPTSTISPSVLTSSPAKTNIQENSTTLDNANVNLTQPYTTNPAYSVMANQVDETLRTTGGMTETARSEALSKIILELVGRANAQKAAGDYQGMNETLKQYNEAKTQRETELANIYAKLPDARRKYEESLLKSQQEQQLEQQLADIQGQITQYGIDTQTGLYGLEGQGRGIPLGLVRGQQEKLYQQRQLGQQTLQGQEANLLTRLGFAQDARELQTKAAEYGITSIFEDAELTQKTIDAIDEQTSAFMDQVDKLSDNARETLSTIIDKFAGMDMSDLPEQSQLALAQLAENAGIDLNTLILGMKANKDAIDFDQQYKLATLQDKQTPTTPTSYTEWQLAGGQSGTGKTYAQFIENKKAGTVNLSASQKDDIATMDTVSQMANDLLASGESIGWAGVGGLWTGSLSQFMLKNFGQGSEEEQNLRNTIGNIKGTIAKLRGGTSFTPNEQALLETYTPTIDDSSDMIKSKLDSLIKYISLKKQNVLSVAGGDYSSAIPTTYTIDNAESAPIGSIIQLNNGTQVRKVGDNEYEDL